MLWTPELHERPAGSPWDAGRVRDAVAAIVRDAEHAFDPGRGWPSHPRDNDTERFFRTLYLGAAGVIWALDSLGRRELGEPASDHVPVLEHLLEAERANPDFAGDRPERSLLMGECGLLLVLHLLSPRPAYETRLAELIAANVEDERLELMWGSPGTMLAARRLGLHELWARSAERLWERWDDETAPGRSSSTDRRASSSGLCTDSRATCSRSAARRAPSCTGARRERCGATRSWRTRRRTGRPSPPPRSSGVARSASSTATARRAWSRRSRTSRPETTSTSSCWSQAAS